MGWSLGERFWIVAGLDCRAEVETGGSERSKKLESPSSGLVRFLQNKELGKCWAGKKLG